MSVLICQNVFVVKERSKKNMRYLIVVDMQNDFVTGSLGSKMAEMIVPAVMTLLFCFKH